MKAELVSGFPTKVRISVEKVTGETATTLDLTKAIKVKTINSAKVTDNEGNTQKAGVEVNVAK